MKWRTSTILFPIVVASVPLVGTRMTQEAMDWYDTLIRPVTAPPGAVIGIVWTILYVLIAWAMVRIWARLRPKKRKGLPELFLVNLIANAIWTPIFFTEQHVGWAILVALIIAGTAWWIVGRLWNQERVSAYLLLPYALWTTFATYLTTHIWILNYVG